MAPMVLPAAKRKLISTPTKKKLPSFPLSLGAKEGHATDVRILLLSSVGAPALSSTWGLLSHGQRFNSLETGPHIPLAQRQSGNVVVGAVFSAADWAGSASVKIVIPCTKRHLAHTLWKRFYPLFIYPFHVDFPHLKYNRMYTHLKSKRMYSLYLA